MGHRMAGDQEVCKIKRSEGGEFQNRSKLKAMYGYSFIASWEVLVFFFALWGELQSGPLTLAVTVSLWTAIRKLKINENILADFFCQECCFGEIIILNMAYVRRRSSKMLKKYLAS